MNMRTIKHEIIIWDWKSKRPTASIKAALAKAPGSKAFQIESESDQNIVLIAPKTFNAAQAQSIYEEEAFDLA